MNEEITNTVYATSPDAQYDQEAKRMIGIKIILAHILVKTVAEFKGMNPSDVVPYIEGEPLIGKVPVEPGLTNAESVINDGSKSGQRIVGMNTENAEIKEGLIRFDLVCYVRMKDGLTQIIINVEAQMKQPSEYHIMNRAVFYASRLISSQKERDFVKSKYDDIKRIYNIWVCMNMDENTMAHFHLVQDNLIGNPTWEGGIDLFNIILVGITKEPPAHDDMYDMHRLLSVATSRKLSAERKIAILRDEYGIESDEITEVATNMESLGYAIREDGIAEGMKIGRAEGKAEEKIGVVLRMHKKGCYTTEEIADAADKSVEEVESIIKEYEISSDLWL